MLGKILCFPFLTVTLSAFAHGPTLGLEHFVTHDTQFSIVVSSIKETTTEAASFQLSNGKKLRVLMHGDQTQKPGMVLAYVESLTPGQKQQIGNGLAPKNLPLGQILHSQGNKKISLMSAEEYRNASEEPTMYLEPIDLKSSSRSLASVTHQAPITPDFINAESLSFDQTALEKLVRQISGADAVTVNGKSIKFTEKRSKAMRAAFRQWLIAQYKSIGLSAAEVCYATGCNVVATLPGLTAAKTFYATSHMDSVGVPGADDNGSGTAAVFEIARAMSARQKSGLNLKYTLKFVAFDEEEIGLVGSKALASKPTAGETIQGVVNMDMIGFDSDNDGAFHAMDCDRADSKFMTTALDQVRAAMDLPLAKIAACTNRSDHASYWKAGVPAIIVSENFFGGDGNVCYHKACDTADKINFPYMTAMTTLIGNTLLQVVK